MVMVSDAALLSAGAEVEPPTWHAHSESAMATAPEAAIIDFLMILSHEFFLSLNVRLSDNKAEAILDLLRKY